MNEQDRVTFEAFATRFTLVEAVVPDRPARIDRGARRVRPAGALATLAGVLTVVGLGVAIGGPLIVGRGVVGGSGDPGLAASIPPVGSTPPASAAASPSGTPDPVDLVLVPLDPVRPVETLPPPCEDSFVIDDRAITSPAQDAGMSVSVVIARVGAVGAGQWNTPDGRPGGRHGGVLNVMRFFHLDVESTIHGPMMPALVTAWIAGGTIGCNDYLVSWLPALEVGAEYVVFLHDTPPKTGTAGVMEARQLWSIRDGSVVTPFSGKLSIEQLIAAVQADPLSSATP